MKHLKLFEAIYSLFNKNEYYSEISESEYRNMKLEIPEFGPNINNTVVIPDRDYLRVKSIFDRIKKDMNLSNSEIRIWTRPYTLDFIDEINFNLNGPLSIRCGNRIQIHLVDDEWYIVEIDCDHGIDLYYKCDQIEGLEKFLIVLFAERKPTEKKISDFKKFNESSESKMIEYEDYLFSFFEKDPSFEEKGENWIYLEYSILDDEDYDDGSTYSSLKKYLSGPRFLNKKIITDYDYGDIYILIADENFYESNIKVSELNWEEHPSTKELKKSNIPSFNFMEDAKIVNGLPNNCTLIRGLNYSGGIEFWPQNFLDDPIYIKNLIELQYLLYKYTT